MLHTTWMNFENIMLSDISYTQTSAVWYLEQEIHRDGRRDYQGLGESVGGGLMSTEFQFGMKTVLAMDSGGNGCIAL